MGGYGLYVWGSFGVTALALVAECWSLISRRNSLRREMAASTTPEMENS